MGALTERARSRRLSREKMKGQSPGTSMDAAALKNLQLKIQELEMIRAQQLQQIDKLRSAAGSEDGGEEIEKLIKIKEDLRAKIVELNDTVTSQSKEIKAKKKEVKKLKKKMRKLKEDGSSSSSSDSSDDDDSSSSSDEDVPQLDVADVTGSSKKSSRKSKKKKRRKRRKKKSRSEGGCWGCCGGR